MVPMANIVPSELHPDEEVRYALSAGKPFKVAPGGSYSTDDRAVLTEAEAHPWLKVEADASLAPEASYRPDSVAAKDDVLSAENDPSFDPKAIERDRAKVLDTEPVAIDAGEDQGKVVETAGVAETLAAADESDTNDDTTAKRSRAKKES